MIPKESDIPFIYLILHAKLLNQETAIMRTKKLVETLRRNVKLPHYPKLDYLIIKEFEKYGLVKKINRKRGYMIDQEKRIVIEYR